MSFKRLFFVTAALVSLTAAVFFAGCSDDECATCPEPPAGVHLSSEAMIPSPAPMDFRDLWIAGESDVFISARAGVVLRRHNGAWTTYSTGASALLAGIWGRSASDVYAVGDRGTVVHFDGSSWRQMESTTLSPLYDVYGTAGDTVYAVGDNSVVVRYDGTGWSTVDTGLPEASRTFYGVWCTPSGDRVFAAGSQWSPGNTGTIVEYDGGTPWTEVTAGSPSLRSIWGTAADNVFACNQDGGIYRNNGGAWGLAFTYPGRVFSIHGTDASNVWMAGSDYSLGRWLGRTYKFDGTLWWTYVQGSYQPEHIAIAMRTPTDGYVLSQHSVLYHNSGGTLNLASKAWATDSYLYAVWGFASDDLYAVGEYGTILHYNGVDWVRQESGTTEALRAMWASGPGDLYAAGNNGVILHNDGTGWNPVAHGLGTDYHESMWGTAANDIWVSGQSGRMWHCDGATWSQLDTWDEAYGSARALWGASAGDYYAVIGPGVMHYDGASWQPVALGGRRINDVHGVSATEVYFTAASGPGPIAADATDNVEQVGITQGFELLRYNGTGYTVVASDPTAGLQRVWALGHNNVMLAGQRNEQPIFGHFDGSSVVVDAITSSVWINDVFGLGGGSAWACGSDGAVLKCVRN